MPDNDPAHDQGQTTVATGSYLGFDFGEKRIGVAVGTAATATATPLSTVRNINGRPEWDNIESLVEDWQPKALIVGLPLTDDGGSQHLTGLARSFAKHLRRRFDLPVHFCDERYTSNEASRIIADNRKHHNRARATREDSDKIAAALILEQWLNTKANDNS